MKTPSDAPPPPLRTHAQPPTQAPHPSVLGRKLNASFRKREREKKIKKPQGAASQRKKPASFIKSPTFIKTSCGARLYQPAPIPPPTPPKPSKQLSLAPLLNQEFDSPQRSPLLRKCGQIPNPGVGSSISSSPLRTRSTPQPSPRLLFWCSPISRESLCSLTLSVCWGASGRTGCPLSTTWNLQGLHKFQADPQPRRLHMPMSLKPSWCSGASPLKYSP